MYKACKLDLFSPVTLAGIPLRLGGYLTKVMLLWSDLTCLAHQYSKRCTMTGCGLSGKPALVGHRA